MILRSRRITPDRLDVSIGVKKRRLARRPLVSGLPRQADRLVAPSGLHVRPFQFRCFSLSISVSSRPFPTSGNRERPCFGRRGQDPLCLAVGGDAVIRARWNSGSSTSLKSLMFSNFWPRPPDDLLGRLVVSRSSRDRAGERGLYPLGRAGTVDPPASLRVSSWKE